MSKKDQLIFYVYCLFDWLGVPRYIGKGHGNRWLSHEASSDQINWMKNEFIEQTWTVLGEIPKIKIHENLSEKEAFEIETIFIKALGRIDLKTGPLTNLTNGGDGTSGFKHSQNTRRLRARNMSDYHKSLTPEQRSVNGKIASSGMSIDRRRLQMQHAASFITRDQLVINGKKLAACLTYEERSQLSKDIAANKTPEERREGTKKANESITHEQRIENGRKGAAALTPEQRIENSRKAAITKKLNQLREPK